MTEAGFHPFGFDHSGAFQAGEERVDGAFRDDQPRAIFQAAQHFKAIQPARP